MDIMKDTKMQPAEDAVINTLRNRLEAAERERDALRAEVIHIKEVEFPRKAQAVADGWRGKCERLEAKIAEMEQQAPVGEMLEVSPLNYELRWYRPVPFGAKLYALPGAQTQGEWK